MTPSDWLHMLSTGIGGVALGWILKELSQNFAARRDDRKAIARALSNLLEVRHQLLAIPKVMEVMSEKVRIPDEARTALKASLAQLIPSDDSLRARYNESINLIAPVNPILAFRLRWKDQPLPFLNQIRQAATTDPSLASVFSGLEDELMKVLPPHLDELIKELALMHGWRIRISVQETLNCPFEMPESFSKWLETAVRPAQAADTAQKPVAA